MGAPANGRTGEWPVHGALRFSPYHRRSPLRPFAHSPFRRLASPLPPCQLLTNWCGKLTRAPSLRPALNSTAPSLRSPALPIASLLYQAPHHQSPFTSPSPWHAFRSYPPHMDYVPPLEVVSNMVSAGSVKGALPAKDLLIRGFLSGALLGFATSLAVTATVQSGLPLVGALVFPVGFAMIVVLGLELATGSFALLPLAYGDGKLSLPRMLANFAWVLLGNLIGSVIYALLLYGALTMSGHANDASGIAAKIAAIADAKTLGYAKFGGFGILTAFVKAILCNWLVCLGVVMAMTSKSTVGKIVGAWLPIFTFFAQGFEHSIVNMFVIPAGILFGAKATIADWWIWNQIPVTIGNFIGGSVFTGLALYLTYGRKKDSVPAVVPGSAIAEADAVT
jgi:formate transporter